MKTIKCKPVEPILIQLKDKEYICAFNMLQMAYLQEELGKLDMRLDELSPAHMCALILYSGIKSNDPEFTIDDANALAINMGPASYGTIIKEFNEATFDSMDKEDNAVLKKVIAQYLCSAKK